MLASPSGAGVSGSSDTDVTGAADPPVRIAAVEASELVRTFGARKAVSGVTFTLQRGEGLAVLGPNGAGKTTLLRILAGLLRATSGSVRIAGRDLRSGREARARAGLISHGSMLYSALTPLENVEFSARMYGVPDPRRAATVALERMGIAERSRIPVRSLSRGMQQRVSIARAMVHEPDVLLLDEPFTGLDAGGARTLSQLLLEQRQKGAALVVVTHNVVEGIALSTRCAIMLRGAFARVDESTGLEASAHAELYHELVSRVA